MTTDTTTDLNKRRAAYQMGALACLLVLADGPKAVVETTIVPGVGHAGCTRPSPCDTLVALKTDLQRKRIVTILASVVAERDLGGEGVRSTGTSQSFEQAWALARRLAAVEAPMAKPDKVQERAMAIIDECLTEAEELVKKEEANITRVAEALLAENTLSGARVAELLAA